MDRTGDMLVLQDFCAKVLREYEDVIAQLIQRPVQATTRTEAPSDGQEPLPVIGAGRRSGVLAAKIEGSDRKAA